MSAFLQLYFWTRRAALRSAAIRRLLVKLTLLAGAVVIAVLIGEPMLVIVVLAGVLVALAWILGRFTAEWRNAAVLVARQHRRLARRGGRR